MFAGLTAALISFDQFCRQIAEAIQASEPQIYGSILLIVLVWYFVFPPKDDADQI